MKAHFLDLIDFKMKDLVDHRKLLKQICDLAFSHGINSLTEDKRTNPDSWSETDQKTFTVKCHDGFKQAQELLIRELLYYQGEHKIGSQELKQSRRDRDKEKEKSLIQKLAIIKQRSRTLSHVADGIAWQIIGSQIHVARRLHIGEDELKQLDNSNLNHAISITNSLNLVPEDFALISDLTSFVQIGDILHLSAKGISIIELKEGKVNEQISDLLDELQKDGKTIHDVDLTKDFDSTTIKQINRVDRQRDRAEKAITVINKDEGIDPLGKGNILIGTPSIETEYYHDVLHQLQENLKNKIWSYSVINNCVHIGMYRDEGLIMAPFVIPELLKKETENFLVIDWMEIVYNVSEPIFAKPFHPDFIIDVLTGKVKIMVGLNLDNLIGLFNNLGLNSKWLTPKETMQLKKKEERKNSFFIFNKRAIVLQPEVGIEMVVGGGIISKILYDNIYPMNLGLTILEYAKTQLEKNETND